MKYLIIASISDLCAVKLTVYNLIHCPGFGLQSQGRSSRNLKALAGGDQSMSTPTKNLGE